MIFRRAASPRISPGGKLEVQFNLRQSLLASSSTPPMCPGFATLLRSSLVSHIPKVSSHRIKGQCPC